jgi:hypothetical protein
MRSYPVYRMKASMVKISLMLSFVFLACPAFSQTMFQTVGIIGSATTQGWDASTPMKLANTSDPHQWTLTLYLTEGEAKFRANNSWTFNWGSAEFPAGTAFQDGPNIQIPSTSYYTVMFNDVTGAYDFQALSPPSYSTIGLIGDATAAGWDASTALVVDANDPHRWSIESISLSDGEVKFRANDAWDVSWGGGALPGGTAFESGPNIPVRAGEYSVTFNDATGEYLFENLNPDVYATVGIIGSATSNGWDASTPMMLASPGDPNKWVLTISLLAGEIKFRANDNWDVNWGGSALPGGTAWFNGPNIPISFGGYYEIHFDDVTGAYNILNLNATEYASVGIVGSATLNGWDVSTPMVKEADGHTWTLQNANLTQGEAKFRANNSWDVNWGGSEFPEGVASQNGPNIPVAAGVYNVTFNDHSREYVFDLVSGSISDIVVLSPASPTADEPVTIVYDASKGVSALQGLDKVYMHSGVILSGPGETGWTNVVGNWGQDDGVGEMQPVEGEPNKWQITLPGIRSYFNVDAGVPVFRIGMVFRSADGTQTGKSASNNDIFVDLDPGDFVRFTEPLSNEVFGVSGEQLVIVAEASGVATNITMEIDAGSGFQLVAGIANSQTLTHHYTFGSSETLLLRVRADINGGSVASQKTLKVNVRQPNIIAALPDGMKNGINYDPIDQTKATLVLLAPNKEFVYLVGDFTEWQINEGYQMNQTPDGEYFWLEVTDLESQKEYVYQYWVDGTIKIGDPYADKVADPFHDSNIPADVYPNLLSYDRTGDGIATVLQTGQVPYEWSFPEVQGGRPANEDLVIYELLVRDFLKSHSYTDLIGKLPYLKQLGVNAIELLPIMEFEANESWGYNPSYLFAPDKYYGTKNDLKAFIDKAHEEGFVVLLDMVLNHQFGQSPMVRMYWDETNGRPSADSPWFNEQPTHPFNVGFDFNHESVYTQRYVDDVNRYWIEEYNFDGYRFDLSKGFTQVNNLNDVGAWSAYDQSRIDILKRMVDKIRETDDDAYVIFEHLAVNEEEKVLADYGIMLWGNMNHNYSEAVNGNTNTDLDWALSDKRGWSDTHLIPYMESHDEERLMVRALNEGLSSGDYDIRQPDVALERVKLASAFFYTLPGPKMLWQFGELGYDISINYNGRTGNKPVPFGDEDGLHYDEEEERVKLYKATAAIINLVNEYTDVFEDGTFSWTSTGQFRRISVSHTDLNVTIIGNFGVTQGSIQPDFQHSGTWYDFFAGSAVNITSTSANIVLAPGEFHIYVDKLVSFPEGGLVETPIAIVTPENLTAEFADDLVVQLNWSDNSMGELGHMIERSAEGQEFASLVTVAENVTSFADAETADGVTYEYRVKAVSDEKPHSDWSNISVVDLPLLVPENLSASTVDVRTVRLDWEDRSENESQYFVERAQRTGKKTTLFSIIAELPPNVTTFTDHPVRSGFHYYYRVMARDADEDSDYSNQVTIRPADHAGRGPAGVASVYPNPVSDILLVTVSEVSLHPLRVRILNSQGTVVGTFDLKAGSRQAEINVRTFPRGMYVVEVIDRDAHYRQHLMIND